jgi:hypothetical protein
LGRTICPFSKDRLYELYWKECQSSYAIASMASELLGKMVLPGTVLQWMDRFGIARRTKKMAQQEVLRNSSYLTECLKLGRTVEANANIVHRHRFTKSDGIKAKRALAKKPRRSIEATRQCAWCGGDITRNPSQFSGKNAYCNKQCESKHMRVGRVDMTPEPENWRPPVYAEGLDY